MTVAELIKELEKYNSKQTVVISFEYQTEEILRVEEDEEGVILVSEED